MATDQRQLSGGMYLWRMEFLCREPLTVGMAQRGIKVIVHGIDEVSNGDMSLIIFDLDGLRR